ncbi:hypothetical protein [Legionella micdadei]|uniref:hypothetical protein n=2 Tax=Legionella micdadei TaxID=451 RepID=UPI0009EF7298|nr:hypothetical protein [Legionella micdadei]ARH00934.1 hypothetical protein B6V88_11210 [Legionella micdadei]
MAYCKKFINGISLINFADNSAELIRNTLISYAYNELSKELEKIKEGLENLPPSIPDNSNANELLAHYKKTQKAKAELIARQMGAMEELVGAENLKKEKRVALEGEEFIKSFASKFRNIRHLADTLSDAPSEIKALQTRLYTEVLFKLDQAEQESQLQTLSSANILDMIQEAVALYNTTADEQLRNQCHKLVQMGIYELIRSKCEAVAAPESVEPNYQEYQNFLAALSEQLPDIGDSSILDNLSDYRSTEGKSIANLLAEVEEKFNINQSADWDKDEKINALIEKKFLFNKLRFGQEDRREYALKIQKNLERDLFWARGQIWEIELFTASNLVNDFFTALAEKRYLRQDKQFKLLSDAPPKYNKVEYSKEKVLKGEPPERTLVKQKLEVTLAAVLHGRGSREKAIFPTGDRIHPIKERKDIDEAINLIKNCIDKKFDTPIVEITETGQIRVSLFAIRDKDAMAQELFDHILEKKGFGAGAYTLLIGSDAISEKISCHTLTGNTLEEIEKQIGKLRIYGYQREKYLAALQKVKGKIKESQVTSISDLVINDKKLNSSERLLLAKLLELMFSYPYLKDEIVFPEKIRRAFTEISNGNFAAAFRISQLEIVVSNVFGQLTKLDERAVDPSVKPIVEKAKLLDASTEKRNKKLELLEAAFALKDQPTIGEQPSHKVKEITKIFYEEYQEMADTLKLTEVDLVRLEKDIQLMVDEMVCLSERTKQGQPAIKDEEQDAYFLAIKQIAKAIAPWDMADVQFKIPHGHTSPFALKIMHHSGEEKEVTIDLQNVKLPYSLIKPPGKEEFIFSYGGSRGVIAPFEGFDLAYVGEGKEKRRLFTHSRLLGVGQYSSVKEVEDLLTGLNKALKKGYVPTEKSTFTKTSRLDPRTRPLSSRNDSHYRIESDVLQNLLKATSANPLQATETARLWTVEDKLRPKGGLYRETGKPVQYRILAARAKGETFADKANAKFKKYAKNNIAYHNPTRRDAKNVKHLRKMIALSQAVVGESARLADLKFSHNDIKPENFLYKKNEDGSYQVKYIDWATGGFVRNYTGEKTEVEAVFAEIFGADLKCVSDGEKCSDASGRFVIRDEKGLITYGVNPVLEILHGERNGTLPYISPKVLGPDRERRPVGGSKPVPALNTQLTANDPYLDDWALTAMTFGICNRQAYFALVKGRAVSDYVVPGILETDGQEPLGLAVINHNSFNEFFACGDDVATDENLRSGEFYQKRDAVMYIPSNQREGEPMHLYRRLLQLKNELEKQEKPVESPEGQIIQDIERILATVHEAVASGEGLTKVQLKEQLNLAQRCLQNYAKLQDLTYQQSKQKLESLQTILKANEEGKTYSVYDLVQHSEGESRLKVLCTYPSTTEQKIRAAEILDKAFDERDFNETFLARGVPGRTLLKECIEQGQEEVLLALLGKVTSTNPGFIELVKKDALLHYAAEQGMTPVFNALIKAVGKAGATPEQTFGLLLDEYGPGRIEGVPHIKWATNCFHIAIRNNNEEQLETILKILPPGQGNDKVIHHALHLCAVWGNKEFFNQIIRTYNELNPGNPILAKEILSMTFPPDDLSPYHLFLQNESTSGSDVIAWNDLKEDSELAKNFLIPNQPSSPNPAAIAAANGNFSAVSQLIQLGKEIQLSNSEWFQFFTQQDENGKNLLNHIIEKCQFDYLNQFIASIKEISPDDSAAILVRLLSNPNPVNPLKNYLDSETNPGRQFAVTTLLLDAICDNYKKEGSEEQQRARTVALLINQDWLIKQAENRFNHKLLSKLLQNDALAAEAKQFLFKKLKDAAQPESNAKEFYTQLYAQVFSPEEEQVKTTRIDLSQVMLEFARQTNDLGGLLSALIVTHKKYDGQIKWYEEQLSLLNEEAEKARVELELARKAHEEAQVQLQGRLDEALKSLESGKVDKSALEKTLEQLRSELKETKEQGEQAIAKLKSSYEEKLGEQTEHAKAELELARKAHEEAQVQLQGRLDEALKSLESGKVDKSALEKTLEQLRSELKETKEQGEQAIAKLKSSYEEKLGEQTEHAKAELELARKAHEEAQVQLQGRLDEALKSLESGKVDKSALEKTLEQLRSELKETKEQGEQAIAKLKSSYEEKLGEQTEHAKAELELARKAHEEAQVQLQGRLDEALKSLESGKVDKSALEKTLEQLRSELKETKEQGEQAIAKLKSSYEEKLGEQTEHAKAELELARKAHEEAQVQLQGRLDEALKSLESGKVDKSALEKTLEQLRSELKETKEQGEQAIAKLKSSYEEKLGEQTEHAKAELELAHKAHEEAQVQLQGRLDEALKSLESGKVDKSALEKTLEQLRSELKETKEQGEQAIAKLKSSYEEKLGEQTEHAKAELELAHKAHEEAQVQLQGRLDEALKSLESGKVDKSALEKTLEQLRSELKETKEQGEQAIAKLKSSYEEKLGEQTEHAKAELELARKAHEEAQVQLQGRLDEALKSLESGKVDKSALEKTLEQLRSELKETKEQGEQAIAKLKSSYEEKLGEQTEHAKAELELARKAHEEAQVQLQGRLDEALKSLESGKVDKSALEKTLEQLRSELKETKEQGEQAIAKLKSSYEEKLGEQTEHARAELELARKAHEEAQVQLQGRLDEALKSLESGKVDKSALEKTLEQLRSELKETKEQGEQAIAKLKSSYEEKLGEQTEHAKAELELARKAHEEAQVQLQGRLDEALKSLESGKVDKSALEKTLEQLRSELKETKEQGEQAIAKLKSSYEEKLGEQTEHAKAELELARKAHEEAQVQLQGRLDEALKSLESGKVDKSALEKTLEQLRSELKETKEQGEQAIAKLKSSYEEKLGEQTEHARAELELARKAHEEAQVQLQGRLDEALKSLESGKVDKSALEKTLEQLRSELKETKEQGEQAIAKLKSSYEEKLGEQTEHAKAELELARKAHEEAQVQLQGRLDEALKSLESGKVDKSALEKTLEQLRSELKETKEQGEQAIAKLKSSYEEKLGEQTEHAKAELELARKAHEEAQVQLQGRLDEALKSLESGKVDKSALEKTLEQLRSELKETKEQGEQAIAKLKSSYEEKLGEQTEHAKAELELAHKAHEEAQVQLQGRLDEALKSLESGKVDKSALEKTLEQLRSELKETKEQGEQAIAKLKSSYEEKLGEQTEHAKAELELAHKAHEEAQVQLQGRLDEALKSLESGKVDKSALEKTLEQLRSELKETKEQGEQAIAKLKSSYEEKLGEQTEHAKAELELARKAHEEAQVQLQGRLDEALKSLESGKVDKSALEKTLEQLRSELKETKEQGEQAIAKLKSSYEEKLGEQTEHAKAELELARKAHEEAQVQLQGRLDEALKSLESGKVDKSALEKTLEQLRSELKETKEQGEQAIAKLKSSYEEKLGEQTEHARAELELARKAHEEAQVQLQGRLDEALKSLESGKVDKSALEKTLEQLRSELKETKEQGEQAIAKLKSSYEEKLGEQTEHARAELELARKTHEEAQVQLQGRLDEALKSLESGKVDKSALEKTLEQLRSELKETKEQGEQAIAKLKSSYEEKLGEQTEHAKAELELARKAHEEAQVQLQGRLDEALKSLESGKVDKSALEKTLEQLRSELKETKEQGEQAIAKLKSSYEEKLGEQTEHARAELELARKTHEEAQVQLQGRLDEALKSLESGKVDKSALEKTLEQLRSELKETKEQGEQAIAKLKSSYEEKLGEQTEHARAELELARKMHEEAQVQLQGRLDEALKSLESGKVDKSALEKTLEQLRSELKETKEQGEQAIAKLKSSYEEKLGEQTEHARAELELARKTHEEAQVQFQRELEEQQRIIDATKESEQKQKELTEQYKKELQELRETLRKAEEEKRRHEEEMLRREQGVSEREIEVKHREDEVTRREERANDWEEELRDHTEKVSQREEEVEQRIREIDLREEEMRRREEELIHREDELRRHEKDLAEREEDLVEREEDLVEREEDLRRQAQRLADDLDPRLAAQRRALAALLDIISKSKDDDLLEKIRDAESNEELEDAGLKPKLVRSLEEEDAYRMLIAPAEDRLEELRLQREAKKARLLDPAQYRDALREDVRELKKAISNLKDIIAIDKNTQSDLRALAGLSPIHLFNPGFQAAAKKHADELGGYYENLAKNCTTLVEYLRVLRADIKDKLASLPSDHDLEPLDLTQKQAIQKRRDQLNQILDKIQPELDLHEPLQKKFYGDRKAKNPLLQQGILKTIKQARSGQFNLKFTTFSSDYEDFDLEQKETFFKEDFVPKAKDKKATSVMVQDNLSNNYYRTVYALKQGKGRLHTINPDKPKVVGTFTEEQQQASMDSHAYKKPNPTTHTPIVKFTVAKFPEGDDNDPEVVTGRVQFAIGIASELLSRYDTPPTKANPIPLDGSDPLQLKYIWTALIVLGQEMPDMKFDRHAIKVLDRTAFDPKHGELVKRFFGKFGNYTFAEKSHFATRFKTQPALRDYIAAAKEAMTNKFGHQEAREEAKKVLERANQTFFAPESKRTVEKIESALDKGIPRSH